MPGVRPAQLRRLASASLIGLIFLCLSWELWLAPLKPGGSMWVLKTLPLLIPLFGILHGKLYTYRWSTLLIWPYFTEGVMRAMTEGPPVRLLAALEICLSLLFFFAAAFYVRTVSGTRPVDRHPS